jgi:hypothetical protein
MTHRTIVKAETVVMIVVGTTTAAGRVTATAFEATTAEITATIAVITTVAGLIQMAIEIAAMAITIFAITSSDVNCALASTREPMIVHPMKAIAAWNMTLPMARQV